MIDDALLKNRRGKKIFENNERRRVSFFFFIRIELKLNYKRSRNYGNQSIMISLRDLELMRSDRCIVRCPRSLNASIYR